MAALLSAGNVSKSFGRGNTRIKVLEEIGFAANAGEVTFLVGPSGCGKTTLISILAGMLKADTGEISLCGESLQKLRGRRLTRFRGRTVGFIFQQFNLIPALDAADNAAIPLVVQGQSPAWARKKACALLEQLGLRPHLRKLPSKLSGGQQQRVAIARALIHDPKLIVCDEPTASLDAQSGRSVMMLLRELSNCEDRAVIVVTHDDRIHPFADRIVEMSDGRIVGEESRETRS